MLDGRQIEQLLILSQKEQILSEVIVWLKAKNLWNDCCRDIQSLQHLQNKEKV